MLTYRVGEVNSPISGTCCFILRRGVSTLTNPFTRGSAPDRARSADLRPGSFKPGHEKRGGRKRGTPNLFTIDYKKAILEAVYRVGNDGNGKDGVVGYFSWVGERHPTIFYTVLLVSLLPLETADSTTSEEPPRTSEESNRWVQEYIGLTGKKQTKEQTVQVKPQSPQDWTGQDFPVGGLMQVAVQKPKAFCRLFVAAFLQPPTKRRRPTGRSGSWPEAGAA
jgi:hypothetical protein